MAVNYGVWGQPETWVSVTGTTLVKGEFKHAENDYDTYKELWDSYRMPLNTIDKSAYFYGIGKESILCNPQYIAPYYDDGDIKYITRPSEIRKEDRPLYFCNSSASVTSISYNSRYTPVISTPNGSAYTKSITLDMNYHRILLCPIIYAVSNSYNTGAFHSSNIDDYFTSDYTSYPRIVGFGYNARCGAGGEDVRTSSMNSWLIPQTEHYFPDLPITSENPDYEFWTHSSGCLAVVDGCVNSGTRPVTIQSNRERVDTTTNELNCMGRYYTRSAAGGQDGQSVPVYFFNPDDKFSNNNKVWTINTDKYTVSGNDYWNPFVYIDVSGNDLSEIKDYILKQVAFLGLPFTDLNVNDGTVQTMIIGNDHLFLPVFDDNGVTTGEYKSGEAAALLPNATWTSGREAGYNPDGPSDNDDIGDLYNTGSRRFFWNNLNVHLMPSNNYYQFIQKLNALNMTDPDNETWQLQFKGLNPTDYIVGAYVSFVKPPKTTATTIMLGPVDMQQTEYVYDDTSSNAGFFTFGTRDILPYYYDFRDYEPYTKIEVYLPLCGTVELETAYLMGASLKIDYYYDIYTMSCTACLYRIKQGQELLYKTINGTIGAQIPMLSANMGAYQNQIKSLENALKQNELKLMTSTAALAAGVIAAPLTSGASLLAAGTAAISGAAGLASSLQKHTELEYQIEHIQPSVSSTGSADPQTGLCVGQLMPKLIIKRPKMTADYDQTVYAKTIGNACCINDILGYIEGDTESPRSGLVVCSSVDTSGINQLIDTDTYISPTAEEVNMIKQALSSGVIL